MKSTFKKKLYFLIPSQTGAGPVLLYEKPFLHIADFNE